MIKCENRKMDGPLNESINCTEEQTVNDIVLTKFYPVIAVPIVITNFFVVISSGLILKNKQEPRSTYLFLGNLAMADGIFGLHLIFVDLFRAKGDNQNILCLAQNVIKISSALSSPFSVGLIAVDRYLYILYGMQYCTWVSPRRVRVIIACTWILSASIGLLPVISYSAETPTEQCILLDIPSLYIIIFSTVASIPLPIIIALYLVILYRALQKVDQLKHAGTTIEGANSPTNTQEGGLRISIIGGSQPSILNTTNEIQTKRKNSLRTANKWKAIKIVALTTGCLTVTWIPFFVTLFVYACQCDRFSKNIDCTNFKELAVNHVVFLGFLNSLLNPIIYAWWHKGFRQFVKRKLKQFSESCSMKKMPSQINANKKSIESIITLTEILR